jgi:hypothetical protein
MEREDRQETQALVTPNRTTVEIIIDGLAVCYRKPNQNWKVLFPFDLDCHRIKFTHSEGLGAQIDHGEQAVANGVITISSPDSIPRPTVFKSPTFDKEVFDFTANPAVSGYTTHERVRLKNLSGNNTVTMELKDAFFSVGDYVNVLTPESVFLHTVDPNGGLGPNIPLGLIARSLKATIVLPDSQSVLTVTYPRMASPLSITGGGLFTLRFDNDCRRIRRGHNDMLMYYQNTIQPQRGGADVTERFFIGQLGTKDGEPTGPLEGGHFLDEGKPCMGAQISDPGNLP